MVTISGLNVYPVKSCRGIALAQARIAATGFAHDREWLVVRPDQRFVTQREQPRLALIQPRLTHDALVLHAPGMDALDIGLQATGPGIEVTCWGDRCAAFDMGHDAANWLQRFLGQPYRLARFDPAHRRNSDPQWSAGVSALNLFSDGFPWLVISQASLDDLNQRMPRPLPMDRFRPNIVIDGLPAYGEDGIAELSTAEMTLRIVKGCTRCAITTTDQLSGERDGEEPLRTLRGYRFDPALRGVIFGQNAVLTRGMGSELRVGQTVSVEPREQGPTSRRQQ